MQAFIKKNEGFVHHNFSDRGKKTKPKYKIHDLVWEADQKETFSKGDTTNRSHKKYENTEIVMDTKRVIKQKLYL